MRALRDPYRPQGSPPYEPGTFFGGASLRGGPRPQTVDEAKAAVAAALAAAKRKR